MSTKVFISYRRSDAKWPARQLYRTLARYLPPESVFMDVDSIPLGRDFVGILETWVDQCDVVFVMIGPDWLESRDHLTGSRRIDDLFDFVRIEIRKGLERGIPVIPLLLDGANVPDAERLPDDIKLLARRQAETIDFHTFDVDVDRLVRRLGLENQEWRHPDGRTRVAATRIFGAQDGLFTPGNGSMEWFRDHDLAPEMIVVPPGDFQMGSTIAELDALVDYYDDEFSESETPRHKVTFNSPFAVGRFPITFAEWDAFVSDSGGGHYRPDDLGWGRGDRPVINVSWYDAKIYIAWLNSKTGKSYRLLSEAEFEYVARAGTVTNFWCGPTITRADANFDDNRRGSAETEDKAPVKTTPVAHHRPNPWGIFQVHGNVYQWCEDPWHESYAEFGGAPNDGSAWLEAGDPNRRVIRGGSWYVFPQFLRSADRDYSPPSRRDGQVGFRVARSLTAPTLNKM